MKIKLFEGHMSEVGVSQYVKPQGEDFIYQNYIESWSATQTKLYCSSNYIPINCSVLNE